MGTKAAFIITISHPWLASDHPNPSGIHLSMILEVLTTSQFLGNRGIRWRYYYYLRSDSDVLLFFDFCSLPQRPRDYSEQALFNRALAHMNFFYGAFPVLVIDYIPSHVTFHGHYIPYSQKGWCWAELNIARIRGNL